MLRITRAVVVVVVSEGLLLVVVLMGIAKLVSVLEGLGLEAVRDKHAAGCKACDSDRRRPMVHASWCSMKLSTLEKTRPQSQEWPRVPQVLR